MNRVFETVKRQMCPNTRKTFQSKCEVNVLSASAIPLLSTVRTSRYIRRRIRSENHHSFIGVLTYRSHEVARKLTLIYCFHKRPLKFFFRNYLKICQVNIFNYNTLQFAYIKQCFQDLSQSLYWMFSFLNKNLWVLLKW